MKTATEGFPGRRIAVEQRYAAFFLFLPVV
jgi:hypothetical protein